MSQLHFSSLAPHNLERVRGFVSMPFSEVMQATTAQIEAHGMEEMTQLLQDDAAVALLAESGSIVRGFALSTPLPWESGLIGKSMWAIRHLAIDTSAGDAPLHAAHLVAAIDRAVRKRGADFLLCKTHASDPVIIHALESNGFLLMDTLLDFVCDCRDARKQESAPEAPNGFVLRLATSNDIEPLMETARAAFAQHFGRFHADPRIGHAAATRIYEEWIRSCAQGWADWIFLVLRGDRVAGYSAWKKPSLLDTRHGFLLGHYSIGAVHPDFSGRGLFKVLTHAGVNKLCPAADWIEGPTHLENRAVQHAYGRLGWRLTGAQHSFHKWLRG